MQKNFYLTAEYFGFMKTNPIKVSKLMVEFFSKQYKGKYYSIT